MGRQIDYSALRRLGLSPLAIACYASLYTDKSSTVTALAARIEHQRKTLYPILEGLEKCGFIFKLKANTGPTYYLARPLSQALDAYHRYQQSVIVDLVRQQHSSLSEN